VEHGRFLAGDFRRAHLRGLSILRDFSRFVKGEAEWLVNLFVGAYWASVALRFAPVSPEGLWKP
jgi:hypothetical protein